MWPSGDEGRLQGQRSGVQILVVKGRVRVRGVGTCLRSWQGRVGLET